jgi:serine/threonine-protein kinase
MNEAEAETDPRVGTIVADRYHIHALLGAGGMGTVYRAEHVRMRKTVAMKVLHREMTYLEEVVARFEREAVAAGRIDHPNVAGATDFGRLEDGSFYLVLEYVDGQSLSAALAGGPFDVDRALGIARQVADALGAAHAHDIVHRDLKPDNVMLVAREDGSDKVKVLDFGIAKMTAPSGGKEQPLTRIGAVMGTVAYMSPEQAVGQRVDARADLYALGIILYEMLTGKVPFEAPEMAQVLAKQITEAPPPLPDSVPADVAAFVFRLLEKTPSARPESAAEVVEAIRALQGFPASGPMSVAGAPVSIRTGTGAVSARGVTVPAVDSPASSTLASRPDRRSLWFIGGGVAAVVTLAALIYGSDGSEGSAAAAGSRAAAAGSAPSALAARSSAPFVSASGALLASAPSAREAPSAVASAPTPIPTITTKSSSTTKVTKTKTASGTVTTRQTSTKRQTTKKSSTTTKKKRRTGPGGIYIPPPSEWF